MQHGVRPLAAAIVLTLVATGLAAPAHATSGWGCFSVNNVRAGDTLNMRAGPAASRRVVDRLAPGRHGILAEDGACEPAGAAPSRLWCPIKHYNGDRITTGWVRLVYLKLSQCP